MNLTSLDSPPLSVAEKLIGRYVDVLHDLTEKCGRDVATGVEGNGRASTVRMPKLPVGSLLPDFLEPERFQDCHHLPRI
jgi:hypothetical protein